MRDGAFVLFLALQASAAGACGYCIEDRIASVYDHAAISKALEQNHHVAFFAIDGPLVIGDTTRRELTAMVEATGGVDKGSARVSVESAALSFGFDSARTPLAKVWQALESPLAARKLSLRPLQVMDRTLTGKRGLK